MNVLEVENLKVRYGAIEAIKGISLHVAEGEVVALLGANGAGKTTTLAAIAGARRPAAGSIRLFGSDTTGLPSHQIVPKGVMLVPEGRQVFATMTVEENLELGAYTRPARELAVQLGRTFEIFPRLLERRRQLAGHLSGGEQQMLAVGRALMSSPKFLLMDEPTLGLAPIVAEQIMEIVQTVNRAGISVLLVEQNAVRALEIASRAYVMEIGSIALEGSSQELLRNDHVRNAYLGHAIEVE